MTETDKPLDPVKRAARALYEAEREYAAKKGYWPKLPPWEELAEPSEDYYADGYRPSEAIDQDQSYD